MLNYDHVMRRLKGSKSDRLEEQKSNYELRSFRLIF
jgi:hypothetical protein